ncbi:MAG: TonB-dependent receptor [Bacteroidales bacterium]|nr:TonB-dependent receptor [Bacteroidales bacterium]
MKKLFSIILLFGALTGLTAAPAPGGIRGIVQDARTREALEFVNISVREKPSGEFAGGSPSDEKGVFLIEGLNAGDYTISVSFMGYKTVERSVSVGNTIVNIGRISLEEDTKLINEVQVVGQQSTMKFDIDRKVFNVAQDIASKGASASDLLENIPSVEVDNEGTISLRGNSSVTVWINGKASGLTSDNRGDILEQLPAENIERIEVITNPGARFSAEGTAGIINIVLKDDIRAGYYGSVQASANYHKGSPLAHNASANINYNSGKMDFYASLGYRQRLRTNGGWTDRINSDDTYLNQENEGEGLGRNLFARGGFSYRPTPKDELSVGAFGMFGNGDSRTETRYVSNIPGQFATSTRSSSSEQDMRGGNVELGYIHKFGAEHEIDFLGSYNSWGRESETVYEQEKVFADASTSNTYQWQPTHIDPENWDIQIDYTNSIPGYGKIEAGYKGTFSREDSPTETWSGSSQADRQLNTQLWNRFIYNQDVQALYASYSGTLENFGYQVGLRGENTHVETQSLGYWQDAATAPTFKDDYFNLFPTVFLTYRLPGENELQLNYTRRTQRPWGGQLNSFVNITDSSNISYGNPQLRPQLANAYELNYIKSWENHTLSVSAYYRTAEDVIQRLSYLDGNIMKSTFDNVASSTSAGTEFVVKNRLFTMLDLTTTVNLYYYQLDSWDFTPAGTTQNIHGGSESNFTWNARMIGNLALPKLWTVQVRGDYRARTLIAQGYRLPGYRIDAGVKKSIGNFSINLNVRDLLESFSFRSKTSGTGFRQESYGWFGGRRIRLSVTYSFGNMTPKPKKMKAKEGEEGGYDNYNEDSGNDD